MGVAASRLSAERKNAGVSTIRLSCPLAPIFSKSEDQFSLGVDLENSAVVNLLYVLYGSRRSTRGIWARARAVSSFSTVWASAVACWGVSPIRVNILLRCSV